MSLDVSKILGGVTFIAVPCLAILTYRGWTEGLRHELPRWRSALGITSIVITFLSWSSLAILPLLDRIGINTGFFSVDWTTPIALLVLAGTSMAFALRGAPRIEAIVAGLLMVAAWTTSVVT
jgi:hypothetical protein